jgi:hypothetical protein
MPVPAAKVSVAHLIADKGYFDLISSIIRVCPRLDRMYYWQLQSAANSNKIR